MVERTPDYKHVGNDVPVLNTRGIRAHFETVPHPDRRCRYGSDRANTRETTGGLQTVIGNVWHDLGA